MQPEPAQPNRVGKKKLWEAVQLDLRTGADRVAAYKGATMLTSGGAITSVSLLDASIS